MEPVGGLSAAPDEEEPEGKRRRLLCEDFASVARCDAGVAQCYLAENDWEMERALNSFFEPPAEDSAEEGRPGVAAEPLAW